MDNLENRTELEPLILIINIILYTNYITVLKKYQLNANLKSDFLKIYKNL